MLGDCLNLYQIAFRWWNGTLKIGTIRKTWLTFVTVLLQLFNVFIQIDTFNLQ